MSGYIQVRIQGLYWQAAILTLIIGLSYFMSQVKFNRTLLCRFSEYHPPTPKSIRDWGYATMLPRVFDKIALFPTLMLRSSN